MVRVFANSPGDLGSIPGWDIPRPKKWYSMPPHLTLSIKREANEKEPSSRPWLWSTNLFTYRKEKKKILKKKKIMCVCEI